VKQPIRPMVVFGDVDGLFWAIGFAFNIKKFSKQGFFARADG
jgi:hypothetical protein